MNASRMLMGSVLAAGVLLTAACGNESGAAGGDGPIKLGAVISLTGSFAPSGEYVKQGYECWAEQLNEAGGIDGREVELLIRDDQSTPATAANVARQLIERDDVFMILGPYGSGATDTMAAITETSQVPMLGTVASDEGIWERRNLEWTFQAFAQGRYGLEPIVTIAPEQGVEKMAMVYEEAGFSISAYEWASEKAKEAGIEVLGLSYPTGATDFSSIVQKIKRFDPDSVVMGGYFAPSIELTKELQSQNVDPDGYYFIQATDGAAPEALGEAKDGIMGYANWHADLKTTGNAEFVETCTAMFDRPPSPHTAAAYAAGEVAQAAMESAGVDREKVREFLANETVDTVQGTYEVNDSGQQEGYRFAGVQWQGDESVVVWPDEQAGAEVVWPKPEWP